MILAAFLSLTILGLLLGAVLAFASIKLHVEINPLIQQIEEILPGVNCGACGEAGCNGYAAAIVEKNVPINLCAPGGTETAQAIAKLVGQEVKEDVIKKCGFVFCKGGKDAVEKFQYSGIQTCKAASIVDGGQKSCIYGCLGFGDCITVCKFDAITMTDQGVPVINPDKCVNCGACYKACPKNIIKEIEYKEMRRVICSSHDLGKIAKQVCKVACIGCGICVKNCPFDAITLENNLAIINREKCTNCGICEVKCPTKAIA
jgi:RnfABCDGE-type electron transport complex B subunit